MSATTWQRCRKPAQVAVPGSLAATNSVARGFDDDVWVYQDRYPNLSQAHRLAEVAAEIDEDSFELALTAFLDGLVPVFKRVRVPVED